MLFYGVFIFFFTLPLAGAAQEMYGFYLKKRQKSIRVPFELQANLIIVPVKINNSDTLRFILDTGVSSTFLSDPKIAAKLGLKAIRKVRIAGVGEGGELNAFVALSNKIEMGDMVGQNQNVVVLDNDVFALSEFVGKQVHGILGYDVFNRFVVTIDFRDNQILLEEPENYKYRPSKGVKYPITIEESKPYLDNFWVKEKGKKVPLKVIIDTGAGHAVSLDLNKTPDIPLPSNVVRSQLGRGLSGVINGYLGRIDSVGLGEFGLNKVVASFPDSSSYQGVSSRTGRQGNIGCELLRRFKVTFNYRDKYIVLKTTPHRLKEPFEHNMSGMDFLAKGEDFKTLFVDRVAPGSPADEAGIEAGDQIILLNNKNVNRTTLTDIYKMFQSKEGKEVDIALKRGNEIIVTKFKLKRLI